MTKTTALDGHRVFTLHVFLTSDECDAFVKRSEQVGYKTATLADGQVYSDMRNNDRVIIDEQALAHSLFLRAS